MILPRDDRCFVAFVVAFVAILAAWYPPTYAIEDEFNILSLATAISRGTVLLDRAGLQSIACQCYGIIDAEYRRLLPQ